MNHDEAKKYVIATIKTGDKERIRRVLARYQEVYLNKKPSKKTAYDIAKEVFKDAT